MDPPGLAVPFRPLTIRKALTSLADPGRHAACPRPRRTRRPACRARPRRGGRGMAPRAGGRTKAVGPYDRGLRPRRPPVPRLPGRAFRRAALGRRLRQLRAGRPARLPRPPARGRDRRALAAARALGPSLARPRHRPRQRRDGVRARRDPRAEGGAPPAPAAKPVRRPRGDDDRTARGRGARPLGAGARRRGAGALLRRGPAHFRGAGPHARGRAGRRRSKR